MKLTHLSDKNLILEIDRLVAQERQILSKVLWHLREIDQRKLYSEMRCGSLFEYCVKILKYSEGQASRRVTASRLLKEMPQIMPHIEDGSLNLMQLNQAKHFFADENITDTKIKEEVIEKIKGKSTKKSEEILWELRSEDSPKKVAITIKQTTLDKIKKVQALKAHIDIDKTLELMADEILRLWDPTHIKRRTSRRTETSRYVPIEVKAAVWKRDGGKCRNCGSDFALQFDHKKSFSSGGKTNFENLELLCRNCNQRKGSKKLWPVSAQPQVVG
jgi:HNH endonuclease